MAAKAKKTPAPKPQIKKQKAPDETGEFIAAPDVVIEQAAGTPITAPPQPNRHYCVYPRDAANPPEDPQSVIQALREAFPTSNYTYFATR